MQARTILIAQATEKARRLPGPTPGIKGAVVRMRMKQYRAIVSITFDDDDLKELADAIGVPSDQIRADDALDGSLDNLDFGSGWVEQFFVDGQPTILRLSGGILVEINEHDNG